MAEFQGNKKSKILLNENLIDSLYVPDLSISHLEVSDNVEISLVTNGNGIHRILGEVLECHTGDMYVVGKGVPHGYFAQNENDLPTVLTLSFSADAFLQGKYADITKNTYCYGVFRDKSPISYAMLSSNAYNSVIHITEMIKDELSAQQSNWQSAINSYLVLLLITISRYVNQAETQVPIRSKEWATVSAAMREILSRCSDCDMTLESIANSLYISKSRLSRLFQKEIGESFLDYVRNVRISRACTLLKDTTLTNEEIVRNCGMKDIPSFYRVFKASMGQTPYQYRMSRSSFNDLSKDVAATSILNDICDNMQIGKTKNVINLVELAIKAEIPPNQILNEGLLKGMNIVGAKFKRNEVYVPEVLLAARSMNESIAILKAQFKEEITEFKGRVCLGTVQGDLHDIGKNLVKMMMEAKGLEVIDLGTDVSPDAFVNTAIEKECGIICCSSLLTTTMGVINEVVKLADSKNIRDKTKILIGGAPVTEEFRQEIGADFYAADAAVAADIAFDTCSILLNNKSL